MTFYLGSKSISGKLNDVYIKYKKFNEMLNNSVVKETSFGVFYGSKSLGILLLLNILPSKRPNDIISDARQLVKTQHGKYEYSIFRNNCEHIVFKCVVGYHVSNQVNTLFDPFKWKSKRPDIVKPKIFDYTETKENIHNNNNQNDSDNEIDLTITEVNTNDGQYFIDNNYDNKNDNDSDMNVPMEVDSDENESINNNENNIINSNDGSFVNIEHNIGIKQESLNDKDWQSIILTSNV